MDVANMLTTDNLSFQVEQKELIHQITLEIPEGSFVGLIGPNGCGKSTLLKTIYRVNKASEGTVYIENQEMSTMSNREVAKRMAVVTQENEISFDFSVMEMMMIGRYAHRNIFSNRDSGDEQLCLDALDAVGMLDFQNRSFLTLSGGEKQRVLIASAFARKSKLIILDEPTNHLDIGYQFLIMDIMKRHEGTTIFTSVHDMNMAMRYCDYVIALDKGNIVSTGKPQEVITNRLMHDLFHVNVRIHVNEDGTRYIQYLGGTLTVKE